MTLKRRIRLMKVMIKKGYRKIRKQFKKAVAGVKKVYSWLTSEEVKSMALMVLGLILLLIAVDQENIIVKTLEKIIE